MKLLDDTVDRIDRFQRRHPSVAFPLAVVKKFGDDKAGYLAALIAYYGFLSMFLLLVVFVTVLGFLLHGDTHLQKSLVHSVLGQFPVIGRQISVKSLSTSGAALAVGIVGTLWGGLGVVKAAQNAMDTVWNVPLRSRPTFVTSLVRALYLLGVLGVAAIGATILSGVATGSSGVGVGWKIAGLIGSIVLNFAVFLLAFRILTVAKLSWNDVLPGAVVAAIAWQALQLSGAYLVGHQVKNASPTYGVFALVIGLLWWLYMGAQITIYAAEINVVRARRLWPRALRNPPQTNADVVTLRGEAKQEERVAPETVDVRFDGREEGRALNPPGGG